MTTCHIQWQCTKKPSEQVPENQLLSTPNFINEPSLLELSGNPVWHIVGGTTTKPKYTLPDKRVASTNQGISDNAMCARVQQTSQI